MPASLHTLCQCRTFLGAILALVPNDLIINLLKNTKAVRNFFMFCHFGTNFSFSVKFVMFLSLILSFGGLANEPQARALGGDRVRAQRADPCAAQQARGRQPASTRPEP
jgi:hypothetical protein